MRLPEDFVHTITRAYGRPGVEWLAALPRLLAQCETRFGLTLREPYALSYNYVTRARRADGQPVVLKLGPPGAPEFATEEPALRVADGRGMVRLLDADAQLGAMLLERLDPGRRLADLTLAGDDETATGILAEVMLALHRPAPPGYDFPTVATWGRALTGPCPGPVPVPWFDRAAALYADLVADSGPAVLLHGDLHHENVLDAGHGRWLAIDPKGLLGEPAYEVGALLYNPYPRLLDLPDPVGLTRRRVAQLSERLDIPEHRLWAWGFAQAVLSVVWTANDGGDPRFGLGCVELFRDRV